jgi:Ca2+-dependent lipid-binding protein
MATASLRLWGLSGAGLKAMDRGGTSDPFIEVEYSGTKFSTKSLSKTLAPVWAGEEQTFRGAGVSGRAPLTLRVLDKNTLRNAPMGEAKLDVAALPVGSATTLTLPVVLDGGPAGTLTLTALLLDGDTRAVLARAASSVSGAGTPALAGAGVGAGAGGAPGAGVVGVSPLLPAASTRGLATPGVPGATTPVAGVAGLAPAAAGLKK